MYQVGTCGGLCLSLFAIYIYLCVFTPGNIQPCLLRILDIVRTRTRDSFNAERRDADTIWNRVAIATRQNYNLGKPSKKCVNKEIFLKGVRRSILIIFQLTRTTIVVSNGRYTFYQIHFFKHNLSNIFYQIPFIKYHL